MLGIGKSGCVGGGIEKNITDKNHLNSYRYKKIESNVFVDNHAQLWGRAWKGQVSYDDSIATVDCDDEVMADRISKCIVELNPAHRNSIYPLDDRDKYLIAIGDVNESIKGVHLVLKLKAWAQAENSYCQLAIKISSESELLNKSDYINHVEVYGDSHWQLSGLKTSYISFPLIFESNKRFFMEVNKEIMNNCEVSVALNVIGFYL